MRDRGAPKRAAQERALRTRRKIAEGAIQVLAARGVDPDGLTVPEAGLFAAGRSAYAQALRGYASGDPEAVGAWLVLHAETVRVCADESRRILADLT